MKRVLGLLLGAVLVIAVGAAILLGGDANRGGAGEGDDRADAGSSAGRSTRVVGLVGSEKVPFFADQRVKDVLATHGLQVAVTPVGSRDMSAVPGLAEADFAFPSSAPAADKVQEARAAQAVYEPFFSPVAIATFQPILEVLQTAGVARQSGGHWWFDVAAYYELAAEGTRWDALPGNTAYPASKDVLVTTTDLRRSNSAAMYLALVAYIANGKKVVPNATSADALVPKVAPLFLGQGYTGRSSEEPFEDYLAAGMGKTPMVLIYEAQFLGRSISADGAVTSSMVLMYPTPDVVSKHTVLAYSDAGARLGELLADDPELARLAATHGFRPKQPQIFADVLTESGVAQPPELVDVIEPPTFGVLERLIAGVERLYG